MKACLLASLLALLVVAAAAARTGAKVAVKEIDCSSTSLSELETQKTALQNTVDAQNTIIDEAAAAIESNQDSMDTLMTEIATQREVIRTQNKALETLSNDYSDVVDTYKSRLTEYRALFETLSSTSTSDSKLKLTPLKKMMPVRADLLKKHEAFLKKTPSLTRAMAGASVSTTTKHINVDASSDEEEEENTLSDSELTTVDSDLGSSDLGSDSSVSDNDDTTEALFKRLRNAVRADVIALKAEHSTAQTEYIENRATILSTISTARTAISNAAASAAALGVTNAEKQATIVAAVAAGQAAEDSIAANVRLQAEYTRICG
jgi:uncharacterized coiled-coil protein SlyX